MHFSSTIAVLLTTILSTSAAPTTFEQRAALKLVPVKHHPTFDAVPSGTVLGNHQDLHYSGFTVSTFINTVRPYPSYGSSTQQKYAVATTGRAPSVDALPTLRSTKTGGTFILNSFWWAASPYFAHNVTLEVKGYNAGASSSDSMVYSGRSATFVYNTGWNAGANGAQLQEAVLPSDFAFYAYTFNITDVMQKSGPTPTLYLDEFRQVSYNPAS